MIFYFSGTGNSRWIAQQLATALEEKLVFIPDVMNVCSPASGNLHTGKDRTADSLPVFSLEKDEKIGFVFPVYSWGPPQIVLDFIGQLGLPDWNKHYMYFVCSCGDETGLTPDMMRSALSARGWICNACFSVCMPNNYILFPGFDVDSKEVEKRKLTEAQPRMQEIIRQIKNNQEITDCHIGSLPWLKSRVVFPLFNRFSISARPYASTDACNGCGKCERHCPVHNVTLSSDRRPVWGDCCTMCVACYHICPQHAITYGNKTKGKGTYFHPAGRTMAKIDRITER